MPTSVPVELHPRKRKLKHNKEVKESPPPQIPTERCESITTSTEIHPHEQPVKNCYQLFLDIRKQVGLKSSRSAILMVSLMNLTSIEIFFFLFIRLKGEERVCFQFNQSLPKVSKTI